MPSMTHATFLLAALAAAPALVAAHGHVTSISVNGKTFPGFEPGNPSAQSVGWKTTVTDNGFVLADSLATPDIICHRGASNAASSATVAAGDELTIKWDTWPSSHVGPIIDYLASCDGDCSTVDKTALKFFKFAEGGLLDSSAAPGKWVTDTLISDGFTWKTTIPKTLKPGNYVLRHEIIALHEGNRQNAAQMYPQCINLEVTGSGSELPTGTAATSLYKSSDAGILFNVYRQGFTYPIPGPALAFGAGAGTGGNDGGAAPASSAAPAPTTLVTATRPATTAAATAVPTTASPAPTTTSPATAAPTTTSPATGCDGGNSQANALYAQCGGLNFTGSTACAEGVCTKMNDWYSQCVPK